MSCRNFLCFFSFLFRFLLMAIELPRPWKFDQEKTFENGKKKSSVQGHFSQVVPFFLITTFFELVAFWLLTIGTVVFVKKDYFLGHALN